MCASAISPFGCKLDLRGDPDAHASLWVLGPFSRQIHPAAQGKLPRSVHSERLTATWQFSVFPSCPQYCRATPTECSLLLRKTGVIDDPKTRGITAGDHRHYLPRAGRKHRLFAPLRVNHPMMHRQVRRADILRMYPRRHRLNALPLPRQPQPLQIPPRRLTPIRMRQRLNQYLASGKKPRFTNTTVKQLNFEGARPNKLPARQPVLKGSQASADRYTSLD